MLLYLQHDGRWKQCFFLPLEQFFSLILSRFHPLYWDSLGYFYHWSQFFCRKIPSNHIKNQSGFQQVLFTFLYAQFILQFLSFYWIWRFQMLIYYIQMEKLQFGSEKQISFRARLNQLNSKPKVYESIFAKEKIPLTLTFNDVLLVPQYGEISSRTQCSISSCFSKNVPLNIPIVSSPMDTVTEYQMAIAMARNGGLGIVHRFMPIEDQCQQILKVKRSGVFINPVPVTIRVDANFAQVKKMMQKYEISSFLVISVTKQTGQESPRVNPKLHKKQLVGLLTNRDIQCFKFQGELVKDFMTPIDRIVYYQVGDDFQYASCDLNSLLQECKKLLLKNKIQKIPLLNAKKQIIGLVSLKDLMQYESMLIANKDNSGRLFVGAAIGANKDYIERAQKLKKAGCDVLVIDVANGHSKLAMTATEDLKERFPTMDIVSGSVATGQGAENLIRSGADGIRCGIGNGSICITRIVAGSGVPQLSALMDTAPVCSYYDIPLCSDGGNKNSGNMCKALAMGANAIMVGRLVAGCQESPGVAFNKDGRFVKMYRGMAGLGANISKMDRTGGNLNPQTFSAEGVQGYIPFTGPLQFVVQGFASGIRSGMSYSGAHNLPELRQKAKFIQITNSGFKQSNVHGISKFQ